MNNENAILIGLILLGALWISAIIIFDGRISKLENVEQNKNVERVKMGYDLLIYPSSYNIVCEEGVSVENYEALGQKYIYSCLEREGLKCAGVGKICLIDKRG